MIMEREHKVERRKEAAAAATVTEIAYEVEEK